jgi:putative ABC transport system substrate-binding protein
MYSLRELVEAGRLISYDADLLEIWRRAAHNVDKILGGAKPADLPIEQPTKYEVMIWGLTISPSLRQRADQVIE